MKKHLSFSFLAIAGLIFTSCGEPQKQVKTVDKDERIPIELTEEDVFDTGKILAYLQNDAKYFEEANSLFLRGLDAFRNESNLDSADYYLRQSILKEPSAKAYYELGNVYMDRKEYDDALLAYGVAEQLDFQPFSKILYNESCIYSLKGETELSGKYLEYALQAGYSNIDHINQDEDLEALRKSDDFKPAVDRGLRGMTNAENLYWLQFKRLFPKLKLPHTTEITLGEEKMSNLKYISYDFEKYISEMRDEMFSREVSKGFYHYGTAYETDDFVAVIYIVRDEFMGMYAPLTYRLATFTHEGKLIDKKDIAGRALLKDPIMKAKLKKGRVITIDLLEPTYEKDPDNHGYYDNPLVSTENIGYMEYVIMNDGKIVETEGQENDVPEAQAMN